MAAIGHFVHVYVDPSTGRPTPIEDSAREVLQSLVVDT
jgi:acyl-CoA thioesterase FadM